MKISLLLFFSWSILFFQTAKSQNNVFVKTIFELAQTQAFAMAKSLNTEPLKFPGSIDKEGKLITVGTLDWTSGFYPGSLWYIYEYTKNDSIKKLAEKYTKTLEPIQYFTGNHDIGFMMYCSYGNAYRITGSVSYKDILVQSAKSLCKRYNENVGSIKSWNEFKSWHGDNTFSFPVIIDNLMNLELLFFATKITGDTLYRHIAINHALSTMKNHVRKDFSSYHVVCYDSITGKVIAKETAQGYADNSTWARGQAWGIYGFTMAYRETKNPKFLKTAIGMANYFLNSKNLPKDKIPYWDFNASQKGYKPGKEAYTLNIKDLYRDASAAAITASALFELSKYSKKNRTKYFDNAITILHSLSRGQYLSENGANGNFLLKHSIGSIPHNFGIDVPLSYADYYFLEALNRYYLSDSNLREKQ